MNEDPVIAIFKLGTKAHMTELLQEGHVYMNTVSYFSKLEDGSPRSDRDEGTSYCEPAEGATLKMQDEQTGEWLTIGTLAGEMRFRDHTLAAANLYSLHVRRQSQYGIVFELDKLGFGDTYVLFRNPDEFLRRLEEAAKRAGHTVTCKYVGYADRRAYQGPIGVFRKFSEHAVEQELRVSVLPGTGAPLSLRLGDLSDIAIIGPTNQRLQAVPNQPPDNATG